MTDPALAPSRPAADEPGESGAARGPETALATLKKAAADQVRARPTDLDLLELAGAHSPRGGHPVADPTAFELAASLGAHRREVDAALTRLEQAHLVVRVDGASGRRRGEPVVRATPRGENLQRWLHATQRLMMPGLGAGSDAIEQRLQDLFDQWRRTDLLPSVYGR